MYAGSLNNKTFLKRILDTLPELDSSIYKTLPRVEGMVSTALEEMVPDREIAANINEDRPIPLDFSPHPDPQPFFIIPSALAKVLHCQAPPESAMKSALRHAGYLVTRSHTKPGTLKTNAPWSFIWEVMREWVRQKAPIKDDAIKLNSPGWGIIQAGKAQKTVDEEGEVIVRKEIIFDAKDKEISKKRIVRYQQNSGHGPMARASRR